MHGCVVIMQRDFIIFFNVIQIWKPFLRIFLDYSCLRIKMPSDNAEGRVAAPETTGFHFSPVGIQNTTTQHFPGCFPSNKFFLFCINILGAFDDKSFRSVT
jgi:hypothetical protein